VIISRPSALEAPCTGGDALEVMAVLTVVSGPRLETKKHLLFVQLVNF
jgi:hypothetical protein